MMRTKDMLFFILVGFGFSYFFFGLSLLAPFFPDISRVVIGVCGIILGGIFFVIATLLSAKKR